MINYTTIEFCSNSIIVGKAEGNFITGIEVVPFVVNQEKAKRLSAIGGEYTRLDCEQGQVTSEAIKFNAISKSILNEIDFEDNVVLELGIPIGVEDGYKTTMSLFCSVFRDVLLSKTLYIQANNFEGADELNEFNVQLISIHLIDGMEIKYGTFFDGYQGGVQLVLKTAEDLYEEMGFKSMLPLLKKAQTTDSIIDKIGKCIVDLTVDDYKDEYTEKLPNCLVIHTQKVPTQLPEKLLVLVVDDTSQEIPGFERKDGVYRKIM